MSTYDVIVLGTGGVGSAALHRLATRGARVLGLDRFPPGHDRGSSHGQTRIIRQAYFEHPDYVPLLKRAYQLWADVEQEAERKLFHQVGLLEMGPPDGVVVRGVLDAAAKHDLPVERVSSSEFSTHYPGLRLPENCVALRELNAGYLLVEDCVTTLVELSRRRGAETRFDAAATGWRVEQGEVVVETADKTYRAGRLVVACGAWAGELLGGVGVPFEIRRKHLHWYADHDASMDERACPAFFFELPEGYYYGFPARDESGVKVAEHHGGDVVDDPSMVDRTADPAERRRVEQFLEQCVPGVKRSATRHAVCMYTMTRDEHFLVDRMPAQPEVSFVAGLSGHGFKFATVLGEILADFALDGTTSLPVEFLNCRRPGLRPATDASGSA